MMKQTTRLLALSAFVLAVILATFGVPALEAPNVAFAQVPDAPTLTAQRSGASTINLSWNAVNGAVRYELYAWDADDGWARLDGGETNPLTAITYAHQNLVADRLFFYQVAAVDAQGNRGAWSARANEVAGQNAPARPALTATPGYQLNTITWPPVSDDASYLLYAWDSGWSQVGGTLNTNSFTHPSLKVGQVYYYQARAMNANGILGAWSAQATATVLSSPTISAPQNLQAAMGNLQVTLTWQGPANTGSSTITGYQYRYAASTAPLPDTWMMDAGNDLTKTVMNLTNGTSYTFEVRAVSSGGVGPAARAMQTPAALPEAPVLTATEGYRVVILNWAAPANNGTAISSYRIEMLNALGEWALETTLPGSATTYTDRGLSNSTTYTYRIFALNAAGDSEASNSADATTLAQPAQKPSAPTSFLANPGPGKVTLNWGSPVLTGGASISRYEYRYMETTDGSFVTWKSVALETTEEVDGLDPGTDYTFEVRAVNSVGAGEAAENTAEPEPTAPTAAPRLGAVLGETTADLPIDQTSLTFTELNAAQNGGSIIGDRYRIQWKTASDTDWPDANMLTPTRSGSTSTFTFLHVALSPGTTYQYRVRAFNNRDGDGDNDDTTQTQIGKDEVGPWSDVVSVTTPANAPDAPTLLASDNTNTDNPWVLDVNSITIKWTEPTNPGGADVTSYEVWVRAASSGIDEVAIAALELSADNLPAARREFVHIGLKAETTYYYRVRARNGAGDSRVSLWSNEVSGATTAAPVGTPGQPTTLVAAEQSGTDADQINLGWTAPVSQGTAPITRYEIQFLQDDEDPVDWDGGATTLVPTPPVSIMYEHDGLLGLKRYVYRVRAVNEVGGGQWSNTAEATTSARAADAPEELDAIAAGTDEILLEWTKSADNGSGFTGYVIQRWDPTLELPAWGNDIDISGPDTTLYTDTGLKAGTEYSYRIRVDGGDSDVAATAFDGTGIGDADVSATTMTSVPGQPTLEIGTAEDDVPTTDSITVMWTAPGDGGSDITGYEIRIYDWAISQWVPEATPAADDTSYKDEDLAPGTRYYYILRAINDIGAGPWSDDRTAVTLAGSPDAPTLIATGTGRNSIQLTWTVPDANGEPITGYQVQRWDGSGSMWRNVEGMRGMDDNTDIVTEYTDTTMLSPGMEYFYRIRALTGEPTNGAWSATEENSTEGAASATTDGDVPGAPTFTTATPTTNSVTLVWEAPSVDGGSDIIGYELRIWNGAWVLEANLGVVLTYPDRGLTPGTKYYYIVRAKSSQGNGAWSAYTTATTTTTGAAPDAPVLTAIAASTTSIRLTWTVPASNGLAISGYVLQKFNSTWPADVTANLLMGSTASTTLYVDTDVDPGKQYWYRILTDGGNVNSDWSMIKTATTHAAAPSKPTLTAVADGQNAIDLSWNAAEANGSAIVRYELQRWDTTNRQWVNVRNDLPSTRTSYKHSGLTADTRYVYRLRGVNRAADNGGLGRWSTIEFQSTAE